MSKKWNKLKLAGIFFGAVTGKRLSSSLYKKLTQ